jgi:leucyl aminopeptidase
MTVKLKKSAPAKATPITVVDRAAFQALAPGLPATTRAWLATVGFVGGADSHALLPGADGRLAQVFAGVAHAAHPFALSALPLALPAGDYRLDDAGLALLPEAAAMSWELGGYRFDLYKPAKREPATLWLKPGGDAERGLAVATATVAARDLVNTPAEHMGPAELAAAAKALADQYGAKYTETVGDALLKKNFPSIHAVGRASTRSPRLVEVNWGNPKHPRLALVGKGVCFDTGGLNIKPGEGMRQMKKDMGGAANALALATLIMALKLPVRLQLLIPACTSRSATPTLKAASSCATRWLTRPRATRTSSSTWPR